MARKVMLSFLGTGEYKECKYQSEDLGTSSLVKFVQEAICQLACKDFKENDKVYIFLTPDAEKTNWEGLSHALSKYTFSIEPVTRLPSGVIESEIWQIFGSVMEQIQEEDEVILDITHGFRTLPMLSIILLNYAKSVKNISVKAIYYGAFETLGPSYKIEETYPNPADRIVPLLNLNQFATLQNWTYAAESFKLTGNPIFIKNLLHSHRHNPIFINESHDLKKFGNLLSTGELEISTNRGRALISNSAFSQAKIKIKDLSDHSLNIHPPFRQVLDLISTKIGSFNGSLEDWEASVKWCLDHSLIPQGITQLQEGIVTLICNLVELNYMDKTHRQVVSQSFSLVSNPKEKWDPPVNNNIPIAQKIMKLDFTQKHKNNYSRIIELRNDINHGGYISNLDANKIKNRFTKIFSSYLKIKLETIVKNAPQPQ